MKWLMHYGTPRHSGRYPWGSGEKPYQTERKSLKKGSIRSTVSINKKLNKKINSNIPLYTYDKNDPWDSKVYEGPFSEFLSFYRSPGGKKQVYSYDYKVKKDLKLAPRDIRKKVFDEILNDKQTRDSTIEAIKAIQSRFPSIEYLEKCKKYYPNDFGIDKMLKIAKADFTKKDIDVDAAYDAFTFALEHPERYRSTKNYMEYMSKKYDAMIDDNNFDVYNKAKDPVVIFKVKENLEYVGSKKLSDIEIANNVNYVDIVLETAGMMTKH